MSSHTLTHELEELSLLIKSPRKFLTNYFDNLLKQIDFECEKYINLQNEAFEKTQAADTQDPLNQNLFSKEDLDSDINQTVQFKLNLNQEVERFKVECLTRITSEYKFNEEFIKGITELILAYQVKLGDSQLMENVDERTVMADVIYQKALEAQRALFGNQGFMLVTQEVLQPDSPFCCLIFVSDDFIGSKGVKFLNELFSKRNRKTKVTYEYEYYGLSQYDQDAQVFAFKKYYPEDLKIIDFTHQNRALGFFDYTEINLAIDQANTALLDGLHLTHLHSDLFKGFTGLRVINLAMNHLASIPNEIFQSVPNLEVIDMSGNIFKSLDEHVFKGLKHLVTINLQYNRLSSLGSKIFDGLTNLTDLNLGNNRLDNLEQNIFNSLVNLTSINLTHNRLADLDTDIFRGLNNLKGIFLSMNRLESVPFAFFRGLSNLEIICLNHNRIKTVDATIFSGLSNVVQILMQNNRLESIDSELFTGLVNLKILDLRSNKLKALGVNLFSDLRELNDLKLVNNQLKELDGQIFKGLTNLANIDFSRNDLQQLEPELLSGLVKLSNISFYNNKIASLPDNFFKNLDNLDRVSLHQNEINTINIGLLFDNSDILKTEQRGRYKFLLLENGIFVSLNSDVNIANQMH